MTDLKRPLALVPRPHTDRLPDLEIMRMIYERCDPDAYISIGSERPTRQGNVAPHWLFPCPVRRMYEWLPAIFLHHIQETQYLVTNPLGQAALKYGTPDDYRKAFERGKPLYYENKDKHIAQLNGIGIDLDCYKEPDPMTAEQALADVGGMCRGGQLPYPTMVALSGRGAYLLWLLIDENGNRRPPPNTLGNRARWKVVSDAFRRSLAHLKPDFQASNLSRWLKRPGTFDRKTGNEVVYHVIIPESGLPLYRLSALCDFLGIAIAPAPEEIALPAPPPVEPEHRPAIQRPPIVDKPKVKLGRGAEPHARRKWELELLAEHRGVIREGYRHNFLLYYSKALKGYYKIVDKERVFALVREMVLSMNEAKCSPPLPRKDIEVKILRSTRMWFANTTIAKTLRITRAEVEACGLESLLPSDVKAERGAAEKRRKDEKRKLRDDIDQALLKTTDGPSDIARSFGVSRQRVDARRRRLERLGLKRPQPPDPYDAQRTFPV